MARIRSVKPEFWSDQKLATRSRDARLLYIALWNFADEQARMVGDPRQVKGLCLPMDDDLGPKEIDALLDELADIGRVARYTVDGEHFLFLPHLAKHQRLDDNQESRYPEPPDDPAPPPHESGVSPEKSGEVQTAGQRAAGANLSTAADGLPAPATSRTGPPAAVAATDGGGSPRSAPETRATSVSVQVRGVPGEVHSDPGEVRPRARAYVAGSKEQVAGSRIKPLSLVPSDASEPDPVAVVFDAWVASFPDVTRRDLTPARRDAIKAALARYPPEDVADAARGWVNDPWLERAQQNDLAQLLHMGSKRKPANILERMRDLHRRGPPQTLGKHTAQAKATYDQMRQWAGGDSSDPAGVDPDRGQAQRELPRPAG